MKRTALTGLFLTAALLASPVFAEDLCGANLQQIKDQLASGNLADDQKMQLEETQKAAMAAQSTHNDKKCIELTSKTLQDSQKLEDGGDGGNK